MADEIEAIVSGKASRKEEIHFYFVYTCKAIFRAVLSFFLGVMVNGIFFRR